MAFAPNPQAPLLVTGATGFIGSHVARAFHRAGYTDLRLLARDPQGLSVVADVPHTAIPGDLRDGAVLRAALQGVHGVVHLAADYRMWVKDPAELNAVNVDAARGLAELAKDAGVARFVHCSSVAAIGQNQSGWPADETVEWNLAWTKSAYTISKHLGHQAVQGVIDAGLPGIILCPSAPVGPGDVKPTPTGQMLVDFLNRRIPGWFEGGFDIVDVEDLAHGFVLAYERAPDGATYILGGDNVTLQQIYLTMEELSGVPAPRLKLPRWAVVPAAQAIELMARMTSQPPILTTGGARMVMLPPWYDDTRARQELGYTTRPFKAAMERAIIDIYKRRLATPPANSPMARLLGTP